MFLHRTFQRRWGLDGVVAGVRCAGARAALACLTALLAAPSLAAPPVPAAEERSDLDTLLGWSADLPPHGAAPGAGSALRDRVVFVSFVSAECAIACVVRTRDLDRAARALPEALRTRVAFLAIGTDPARDGAGRLRTFADGLVGPDSPLRVRSGDAAGTAALAARLHYPAASLPEPPPTILAFDRRGRIAMTYAGDAVDGERLLRDAALLDTFAHGIGRPPRADPAPF